MAHFAQLSEKYLVTQVIVVNNETVDHLPFPESEPVGAAFCKSLFGDTTEWKQTSYNASFRKNYAGIGFTYDLVLDAFIPPQPYPSWVLNTLTCQWEAPKPYPNDGLRYEWDETAVVWARFYAPFFPSSETIVQKIMEHVSPLDCVYDLGCGDGRVLLAASKIGATIKGAEIRSDLASQAETIAGAKIVTGDALDVDLTGATVVYLYLDQDTNIAMRAKLQLLPAGTKVLSYGFDIPGLGSKTEEIVEGASFYVWRI